MSQLAQIDTRTEDNAIVVSIVGEVDISNASDIGSTLEGSVPQHALGLILDLSLATYIDSAGGDLLFRLGGGPAPPPPAAARGGARHDADLQDREPGRPGLDRAPRPQRRRGAHQAEGGGRTAARRRGLGQRAGRSSVLLRRTA